MTYFPVVVKAVHLKELRNYLEKLHGKTFFEVFKWFSKDKGNYSQFSIIMNYLFRFHRNDYVWHVYETVLLKCQKNGQHDLKRLFLTMK